MTKRERMTIFLNHAAIIVKLQTANCLPPTDELYGSIHSNLRMFREALVNGASLQSISKAP
jgi:hypothetical protein